MYHRFVVVAVQPLSRVRLFVTPWTVAYQAPLSSILSGLLLTFRVGIWSSLISSDIFSGLLLVLNSSKLMERA